MKDHHSSFSVGQMASILGVSPSGYYDFLKRSPSIREQTNQTLVKQIKAIFEESDQTYGSPRVHAELRAQGYSCSRNKVARLMRQQSLQAKMYKKFKKTTRQSQKPYYKGQDLVQRHFYASQPNRLWVADISYLRVNNKWSYLAIVLDLFSRKVVGMAVENHMKVDLILKALTSALIQRRPPSGLIHHSDLGSQFTSHAFYQLAKEKGITLSHGKTGSAYDNAAMESFFHTLKTELTYFKTYQTLEEARLDIFTYIHTFYNSKRRHSTLNYQSPNQWEYNYQQHNFISV
jgi:transposase InsO family protein